MPHWTRCRRLIRCAESGAVASVSAVAAIDPKQPVVVWLQPDVGSRFESNARKYESWGIIESFLNVEVIHAISISRHQA